MSPIDPGQLTRLLEEHGAALVLYARQWCATPEDVVQAALLRLVQQRSAPERLAPWLYRVVRNGAISASRSAARRGRREAASAGPTPWFEPTEDARLDANVATEALRDLPVEQRETIVARIWGGLSLAEVAELTGTSTSTAHRRYQLGLASLRERLGVACPSNPARRTT